VQIIVELHAIFGQIFIALVFG